MMTPTTAELRTAIEILKMLGERNHEQAAHGMAQLPDTPLGKDYAARFEARAGERISHIETVSTQLKIWREELLEQQKHQVMQSV